jgi:hypothetical protein
LCCSTGALTGATPNTSFVIEFFSNSACENPGFQQAKNFIGDLTVMTDASGNASFNLPAGPNITATASATGLNTSSLSNCVSGANPADNPSFFVGQHYSDFLNRQPDSGGLAFWAGEITQCGSNAGCIDVKRSNVSAAFFLSIEFQETGYLVERVYKVAYGDAIGNSTFNGPHTLTVPIIRFNEFLLDGQQIGRDFVFGAPGADQILENNKVAFFNDFVARTRFTTAYPSNLTAAQFVDALNSHAGNALSPAERDQLVNQLNGAIKTRAQVLRAIAEDSDLNNLEKNRAFVLMQYFGYLRRDPNSGQDTDHTGYDFWLTKLLDHHGNYIEAEMVRSFLLSTEYRARFGSP